MTPGKPDLLLRVTAARFESDGVTSFELAATDGATLPAWTPGAHIDIHLPSGRVRQYSLCGDIADRTRYRIAVLELTGGRGGSVEAHRELRPGVVIGASAPRSAFALVDAARYVFIAGGIGITPLLPMINSLERTGTPWELTYCARSAQHFSFAGELRSLGGGKVRLLAEDVDGRPDLGTLVADADGAAVFCCGPAGLMDSLAAQMTAAGRDDVHIERFTTANPPSGSVVSELFTVELARSGLTIDVGRNQSVLEAVRSAGVDAPASCEMGICGTCETKVLSGTVAHRDDLLTDDEKRQGSTMMICVSRAAGPRLVLDL
ncbi:PDR/VanB family oxidoreductase [Mycolicibacterium komossense]|uniref:Oxidoreductase n=1 Tax=Mycolicibacterium komossense TaxID=1779 RepID=A0ABT3CB58_9MYCO|nr:PDR/VanB family oxidoreductase [Mycolicibacterium komossense]MCV7226671.1 oxidoreductase [Mycolicibacterium komossense]